MADSRHSAAHPYPHQVGGHGLLAATPQGNVIKPSSLKELDFYNYIHSDQLPPALRWIRNVTPKYHGQVDFPDIKIHTDPSSPNPAPSSHHSRQLPLTTIHHPSNHIVPTNTDSCTMSNNPTSAHSISAPHTQPVLPVQSSPNTPPAQLTPLYWRTSDASTNFAAPISPWAARMGYRRQNASSNPPRRSRPSIELEDINAVFILPCVMDCKIGTRHYDDDASEAKRQRHIWKAKSTTSARCGVRYTGMQTFKRDPHFARSSKGALEHRDKYLGRTLTEPDLVPWATWFFHDNHRVRIDCVQMILDKIRTLRANLDCQRHFFFYSSSLLLVYEGALDDIAAPRVDVRMIDFAHTVRSKGCRDDGYVLGIDYLIKILAAIVENEKRGTLQLPTQNDLQVTAGIDAPMHVKPQTELSKQNGREDGSAEHNSMLKSDESAVPASASALNQLRLVNEIDGC